MLDDGTVFDSSRAAGRSGTFKFTVGYAEVTLGCAATATRDRRRRAGAGSLTPTARAQVGPHGQDDVGGREGPGRDPPDYAYGNNGAGDMIQPGATLTFEIELVEVIPEPSPMGTVLLQIAALIFIVLVVLFILWHQGHAFHGGKGHPHPSGDNKWHPPESKDWHGEH